MLESAPHSPDQPGYKLWVQRLAMALRQTDGAGGSDEADPAPWRRAQALLTVALEAGGDDPETCGIAAGLAKQRGLRALDAGVRPLARAHLQLAADLYERGMDADPSNFYAGLNAITTLRLLGQRLGDDQEKLARHHR